MATKAPPQTLNQLRLGITILAGFVGNYMGIREKAANDALWDTHFRAQWAARAGAQHAKLAAERAKLPETIPAEIPAELHDLYKTFKQ